MPIDDDRVRCKQCVHFKQVQHTYRDAVAYNPVDGWTIREREGTRWVCKLGKLFHEEHPLRCMSFRRR